MAGTRIMAHRIMAAGLSFAARSHDMANAYGAGKQSKLWESSLGAFREKEKHFFHQRRHLSAAYIVAADGSLLVQPGDGGLMGDSNEPDFFMRTFYKGTKQWLFNQFAQVSKPMVAKWEHTGNRPQDGSVCAFVDDIFRFIIPPDDKWSTAESMLIDDGSMLDHCVGGDGYKQNHEKEEVVASFRSRRSNWQFL